MRLTDQERATITETIMSFDKDARLYLFGSRVDDNRKGGDIDLLVLTDKLTFTDKLKIKARLWERLGEQKIDLLITDDESRVIGSSPIMTPAAQPFVQIALEYAIRL